MRVPGALLTLYDISSSVYDGVYVVSGNATLSNSKRVATVSTIKNTILTRLTGSSNYCPSYGNVTGATAFGIHIAGGSYSRADRNMMVDTFGCVWVRDSIAMYNWPHNTNQYDTYISGGKSLILNLTWGGIDPVPFNTDMVAYSATMSSILNTINLPYIIAVENEEINSNFHTGSIDQYVTMVQTVSPLIRAKNVKVTNGGVYGNGLYGLTYRYLKTTYGQSYAQTNFGNLVFTSATLYSADHPGEGPAFDLACNNVYAVLAASASLDFVNIHHYEVDNPRISGSDVVNLTSSNRIIQYLKEYITTTTGKPIICNETSIRINSQSALVTDFLQNWADNHIPYVLWWDNDDDNSYGDSPLNDQVTPYALRPNGVAFKSFISSYYHP